MSPKDFKILGFLSSLMILFACWFLSIMNDPSSFVSFKEYQKPIDLEEIAKQEYLADLEIRNKIKMKKSYDELIEYAVLFKKEGDLHSAAACYYFAKTIYPEKEEPRRLLSEAYISICAEYGEYCSDAKKEIYFAFKYVPDSSIYYSDLLDMATAMDLYQYIDKHEDEVLPMIYDEKMLSQKF